MNVRKNIPDEIDYNLFKWLRKGDHIKIAAKTKMSESMVSATLRKLTFNEDIICEALMIVTERMEKVLQRQAEAQRLSKLIEMKKAS